MDFIKLSKDYVIEGQVFTKGTELELKESTGMYKDIKSLLEPQLKRLYSGNAFIKQDDNIVTFYFNTQRIGRTFDVPSSYKMEASYVEANKLWKRVVLKELGTRNLEDWSEDLEEGKSRSGVAMWVGFVVLDSSFLEG